MSKDYFRSTNKTKLIGSSFLLNKLSTNGRNKFGSGLVFDKKEKEDNYLKYSASAINMDLNGNYCNCNKFKITYFCRECNSFICHFCFRVIF